MREYVLKYQKSDVIPHSVHHSWHQLCEAQTKEDLIAILRKHLYEPGEYILDFRAYNGIILRKKEQHFFSGQVLMKTNMVPEGIVSVGFIDFDYSDDTFSVYDFKTNWPIIDCGQPVMNSNAKFVVAHTNLSPSPKEFEIICEKETQRFWEKLHKSVHFPLEITCDYPDVVFEICYDFKPDAKIVADTLKIMEDCVTKYNKRHEEGIHYIAETGKTMESKKTNAVYVYVDFGDCELSALASVLKAIDKSDLPVKQIILK